MNTQQDADIATLVGEMEDVACESITHGILHHDGSATHYARVICTRCELNAVKAFCATIVRLVNKNVLMRCGECGGADYAQEVVTILGPVNA